MGLDHHCFPTMVHAIQPLGNPVSEGSFPTHIPEASRPCSSCPAPTHPFSGSIALGPGNSQQCGFTHTLTHTHNSHTHISLTHLYTTTHTSLTDSYTLTHTSFTQTYTHTITHSHITHTHTIMHTHIPTCIHTFTPLTHIYPPTHICTYALTRALSLLPSPQLLTGSAHWLSSDLLADSPQPPAPALSPDKPVPGGPALHPLPG